MSPAAERDAVRRMVCREIRRLHRAWATADLTDGFTTPVRLGVIHDAMTTAMTLGMERLGLIVTQEEAAKHVAAAPRKGRKRPSANSANSAVKP